MITAIILIFIVFWVLTAYISSHYNVSVDTGIIIALLFFAVVMVLIFLAFMPRRPKQKKQPGPPKAQTPPKAKEDDLSYNLSGAGLDGEFFDDNDDLPENKKPKGEGYTIDEMVEMDMMLDDDW